MKFSYNELARLVDLSKTDVDAVVHRLTFAGFEVEGVEKMAEASKLVIGQVLTCVEHPDSDHLHILTVDCGKEGIRDIVCGAPNVRVGLKVILALPGCVLPAIGVTIKPGMIRGKQSDGMCCSLVELGVDKAILSEKQVAGIEELDENAPVGETDVLSYLHLDDVILDINVLPNRPDCLSYLGMAREISSLMNFPLRDVPDFSQIVFDGKEEIHSYSKSDRCVRFDLLGLKDLVPQEKTPLDIVRTLEASGIRALSPIVDLGNYVMLLTGQPFNMYDADDLASKNLYAIDDFEGKFKAFDGKEYDLIKGDIVIADDQGPVCLAGIMAGDRAMVQDKTKNVLVEAAIFYHADIRHTSARLGLSSFSSLLFTKGRNPRMIPEALAVLVSVLPRFFKNYKVDGYFSDLKAELAVKPFYFSIEDMNKRLGCEYTEAEVDEVLKAYRVLKVGDMLTAPIDRVDLNEDCDMQEEVFRYFGSPRVQPSFDHFPLTKGELSFAQKEKRAIREMLIHRGFDEILTYTLISKTQDASIRIFDDKEAYTIQNPMTKDHEVVRLDLVPSLLNCIRYNVSHQHENLKLFEVSAIDHPDGVKTYLAIGLRGADLKMGNSGEEKYDFFYLKGIIEMIFEKLGIPATRYRLSYSKNEKFHPTCSADIFMGKELIGTFGQLHPSFSKDKLFIAELDLGYLLDLKVGPTKFKNFSSHPMVRRDLSVRLNGKADFEQIKKTILRTRGTYVNDVLFFDLFKDPITKAEYLGLTLLLGKEEATLTDAEITDTIDKVVKSLKGELSLSLRGEHV